MRLFIAALLLNLAFTIQAAEELKLRTSNQLAVNDKVKNKAKFIQLNHKHPKRKAQVINVKALQTYRLKKMKLMRSKKIGKGA